MPLRRTLFAMLIAASLSCGDDDTTTGPDDFLPIFTNSWQSTDDRDHRLNLVSQDDGQQSGAITGTESLNFDDSDLDGTFQGVNVTRLTIHRPAGDKVYTGRLVLPNVLQLKSGSETLIFFRPQ